MPEHNEPLARHLFREAVLIRHEQNAPMDFAALARDACDAQEAFEAETLRRLAAESNPLPAATPVPASKPTPPPGIPPEPAAGVGAVLVECRDCGGYGNGPDYMNGSDVEQGKCPACDGKGRVPVVPGNFKATVDKLPTAVVEALIGKPTVTVPVPPPAKFAPGWPRWGTVKGPAAAWHLWASAEVAEAECGESDGTDEPIEFVHDPPPGAADLVCASCIVLDLPAAKRWADELLADPELPEQEAAPAEQPKEEPAPKAKRAPKLCMIPGCGQPGARVRNEHGATEDGGLWCGEHGKLLKPEERRSCHARWKRLAADNRKAERLNARANPRAVRRG